MTKTLHSNSDRISCGESSACIIKTTAENLDVYVGEVREFTNLETIELKHTVNNNVLNFPGFNKNVTVKFVNRDNFDLEYEATSVSLDSSKKLNLTFKNVKPGTY